jgi:Ca-activated chloride channel family protein
VIVTSIPTPVPARRRSSQRIWIVGGLLALLAGGATIAILKPWQKPPPAQTQRLGSSLELAAGEVLLERDGATERLLSGTPLPADAVVRTGAGARAMIRLGDGSRVFLRDGSRVTLGGGVTLTAGQLWLEAPPLEEGQEAAAHRVGEHTVSLSDGGASLSLQDGTATIYVAEGLAIVSASGGRAEVKAGEQATISSDGAPKVAPVGVLGGLDRRHGRPRRRRSSAAASAPVPSTRSIAAARPARPRCRSRSSARP